MPDLRLGKVWRTKDGALRYCAVEGIVMCRTLDGVWRPSWTYTTVDALLSAIDSQQLVECEVAP